MLQIESCFVYPVKGMTPIEAPSLVLKPGESVEGDRAFVFAFADAERRGAIEWVSKNESITLLSWPELAAIETSYDSDQRTLTLRTADGTQASAQVDDTAQRESLAGWLAAQVKASPRNPLSGRPEREPLVLLGDGSTRFTDRGPTQISIGAVESLAALTAAAKVDVDMRRFRFNFVVAGGEAWDDFGWAGERLRIGETLVEVSAPLVRCKAVNASPQGGGRDINLLDVLDSEFGHLNFGVEANVLEGGVVRPGDPVSVLR